MSQLLEKAVDEVRKRPESEQDAIAKWILDELEDDARWDLAFAHSQDQLSRQAAKVREDVAAGRIKKLGMDEL